MKIQPFSELPKNTLSQYLIEKNVGFMTILLKGITFYVPIDRKLKKVIEDNPKIDIEDNIRNVIDSTYLQLKELLCDEIQASLSRQIDEGFEKMYAEKLRKVIFSKFDASERKLLEEFK